MAQFTLFYENSILSVHSKEVFQQVMRVCSLRNRVFILGSDGDLFFGDLDPLLLESPVLDLTLVRHGVIDVDCDSEMVYLVDETGRVFNTKALQPSSSSSTGMADNWKEVVILGDMTCPHGQRNTTERVLISRVTCNNDGVLFTTNLRELYGIGEFNEILTSDVPQRIECFRGQRVMQVAAGNNFVVVLTQKKRQKLQQQQQQQPPPTASTNTSKDGVDAISVDSVASELYVNAECPKCMPERDGNLLNPLHQHLIAGLNHHSHPMSNVSKSTTETSVASSPCPSDENPFEEDVPPHGKSTPTKSHKDSALNFFLDLSQQQTKLLTENVTKNITSMLSEGVKSLSRHMSGSDNTDTTLVSAVTEALPETDTDKGERNTECNGQQEADGVFAEDCEGAAQKRELSNGRARVQLEISGGGGKHGDESMEQSEASNSMMDLGSATDLHSEFGGGTDSRIARLCRMGSSLIDTDVWCFGSVNRGHLGTGDHIKRTCINSVVALSGQAVVKIECGKEHSAALTLDGRLFLWGSNGRNQISAEMVDNFSAPREIRIDESILDVACGHGQTVILCNDLRVAEQSHGRDVGRFLCLQSDSETALCDFPRLQRSVSPVLASDGYTVHNAGTFVTEIREHLSAEQRFLREALSNSQIIRLLAKKLGNVRHGCVLDKLCQQYQLVVQVTALSVRSLEECYARRLPLTELVALQNHVELIAIYRTYVKRYCDVLCVPGFKAFDPLLTTSPDCDRIFRDPLSRVWPYIQLIYDVFKMVDPHDNSQAILEKRRAWERFAKEMDQMVQEAKATVTFWEKNRKSPVTLNLQIPQRRLVLDSKELPLKAMKTSPWLVLFSDVLCNMQHGGSVIPLETLWVSPITDTEQRENAFKIVTPLETTILVAQSHSDKMRWLSSLEHGIRAALKRPPCKSQSKVPQFRNASFVFPSDHAKYGGVNYFGRWHLGQMHGIGHLVFADGRVYNGQMSGNEISGFGRMYTPRGGIYEGDFERGKYHGYGVLQNRTRYEGNFRNGLYNGHGMLMNDEGTYIGEFVDNHRQGYGVLDETWTGNKYMGMFLEGRKQGRGICITMAGDYFEGQFQQDQLSGRGVASFEATGHGSYYEGEMTIGGPSGKGVMYLTSVPVDAVAVAEEWREGRPPKTVKGVEMRGTLGGTWQEVQVVKGTLQMTQEFPKFSPLFGQLMVECSEKWQSLFNDWQLQVFGVNLLHGGIGRGALLGDGELDPKMVWGKVAVFTNNAKSKEKLKSDEFLAKNYNCVTFLNQSAGGSGSSGGGGGRRSGKMSSATSWDNISIKSQQIQNMSTSFTGTLGSVSLKGGLNLKSGSQLSLADDRSGVDRAEAELELSQKLEKFEHLLQEVGEDRDEYQGLRTENALATSIAVGSGGKVPPSLAATTQRKAQHLDFVPSFGMTKVDRKQDVVAIREYLRVAFKDPNHPLGVLASKISHCFYTSYGCWKIKPTPILSSHAMEEWESITRRVYAIVRHMFPGLPVGPEVVEGESLSFRFLLYPIMLSEGIYSLLFVLYASKCSQRDELYRQRLIACEKKSTRELAAFLKIEETFLVLIDARHIKDAIETFKQLTDKYCPLEMLGLVQQMFKAIEEAKAEHLNEGAPLNSDDILPIVIYMVIRANVQHLGAELSLLEDLMGKEFDLIMRGYAGYCFTTLEASYQHILGDKFFG